MRNALDCRKNVFSKGTTKRKAAKETKKRKRGAGSQAPALAVGALGAYCAGAVAYGVAAFPSVPEAADALRRDVAQARRDLRRQGFAAG